MPPHGPLLWASTAPKGAASPSAWAVEEATRRHLPLMALCAWQSDYAPETVAPLVSTIEEQCRSVLEAATADVRKLAPRIELRTSTVHAQTSLSPHCRITTRGHGGRRLARPRAR